MPLTKEEIEHYEACFKQKTKAGGDQKLYGPEAIELFREAGFTEDKYSMADLAVMFNDADDAGNPDMEMDLQEFKSAIERLTLKERIGALLHGTIGKSGSVSVKELRDFIKPDGEKFDESFLQQIPIPVDAILASL